MSRSRGELGMSPALFNMTSMRPSRDTGGVHETLHLQAPCAESSRAVASPRPLLAPVITTIFPSMFSTAAS
jgi:hypothetical protein